MADDVLFSAKECPCLNFIGYDSGIKSLQGMLADSHFQSFAFFETTQSMKHAACRMC